MLAHEYGHVFAGHIDKSQTNAGLGVLAGIAVGAAIASATGNSDPEVATDIITGGANAGRDAGWLAFSPKFELEADYYAALILENAGIDLDDGKDLLLRLGRATTGYSGTNSGGWGEGARLMATTHPANDYRIARWTSTSRSIAEGKQLTQHRPGYEHDSMLRDDARNRLARSLWVKSKMTRWVNRKNGHSGVLTIGNTAYKRKCDRNCVRISEVEYTQGQVRTSEYWLCRTGAEWVPSLLRSASCSARPIKSR